MRNAAFLAAAIFAAFNTSAAAKDRPVTDQEKVKLEAALKSEGCAGGKMEFDDDVSPTHPAGKFEVDDAMCGDKRYDLAFDHQFKMIKKKVDATQ